MTLFEVLQMDFLDSSKFHKTLKKKVSVEFILSGNQAGPQYTFL